MRNQPLATRILALLRQAPERAIPTDEITATVGADRWEVITALEHLQRASQVERLRDGTSLYRASWRLATPPRPPTGWRDWGEGGWAE